MKFISIAISSIGIAIILVDILSLGSRIKKLFKIDPYKSIKPFDCITCMAFWSSVILSVIYYETELQLLTSASLTLIGVYVLERLRVLWIYPITQREY